MMISNHFLCVFQITKVKKKQEFHHFLFDFYYFMLYFYCWIIESHIYAKFLKKRLLFGFLFSLNYFSTYQTLRNIFKQHEKPWSVATNWFSKYYPVFDIIHWLNLFINKFCFLPSLPETRKFYVTINCFMYFFFKEFHNKSWYDSTFTQ